MFSSETFSVPLVKRGSGVVVGSTIMVAVAAALVSAKTLPFCFGVVFASFVAAAFVRGRLGDMVSCPDAVVWYLAAFLGYTVCSSAWAIVPSAALVTTIYGVLIGGATVFMLQLIRGEERLNLLHMGEGLWLGFAAALLYLAIELVSGQSIKIFLYNLAGLQPGDLAPPEYFTWADGKIVAILREDLTRNMAPVTIFLWPAVTVIMGAVPRRYAAVLSITLVLIAGVVVMAAWHETSKGAFLVGLVVFLAAHLSACCRWPVGIRGLGSGLSWCASRRAAGAPLWIARGALDLIQRSAPHHHLEPHRRAGARVAAVRRWRAHHLLPRSNHGEKPFGPYGQPTTAHAFNARAQRLPANLVRARARRRDSADALWPGAAAIHHGVGIRGAPVRVGNVRLGRSHGRVELRHLAVLVSRHVRPLLRNVRRRWVPAGGSARRPERNAS